VWTEFTCRSLASRVDGNGLSGSIRNGGYLLKNWAPTELTRRGLLHVVWWVDQMTEYVMNATLENRTFVTVTDVTNYTSHSRRVSSFILTTIPCTRREALELIWLISTLDRMRIHTKSTWSSSTLWLVSQFNLILEATHVQVRCIFFCINTISSPLKSYIPVNLKRKIKCRD
jgi:hypothetical protein